jgi:hypothetical protein
MPRGKCKIKDGWAGEDSVIIVYDDGTELEVPASRYEAQGYEPPIASLPDCSKTAGS